MTKGLNLRLNSVAKTSQ